MTDFTDMLSDGIELMYEEFGEPAKYTTRNAEGPCYITVVVERNLSQYGEVAQVSGKTAVVRIRTAEVPQEPLRGETFCIHGKETLTVDSVFARDGWEWWVLTA